MGHFGEIRLADPVFSAVVLPTEKDSLERGSVFVEIYSVLKVLMYFCNALASNCVKSSPEQGKIYCHKNYIKFGVGGSKSLVA